MKKLILMYFYNTLADTMNLMQKSYCSDWINARTRRLTKGKCSNYGKTW